MSDRIHDKHFSLDRSQRVPATGGSATMPIVSLFKPVS
jgi:hypothetical protein